MKDRLAAIEEYVIGPMVLDSKERKLAEKSVEKKSCDIARAHGWLPRKYKSPSNRAAPDRMFIKGDKVIFIEYKRPGNYPTKQQRLEAAKMIDHGATVYWTNSVRGTKEALGIIN